jgi:hypothetical protein
LDTLVKVIYEDDSMKIGLQIQQNLEGYYFEFILPTCLGEAGYFSIKIPSKNEVLYENDITGEKFIDNKIYYLNGFEVSKNDYKKLLKTGIDKIKIFTKVLVPNYKNPYLLNYQYKIFEFKLQDIRFLKNIKPYAR